MNVRSPMTMVQHSTFYAIYVRSPISWNNFSFRELIELIDAIVLCFIMLVVFIPGAILHYRTFFGAKENFPFLLPPESF